MSSYRDGKPTGLTTSRVAGDLTLGGRDAVAAFTGRHARTIQRFCVPTACDVGTRADLYDLAAVAQQLDPAMRNRTRCVIPDCGSPVMLNMPLPICIVHAATVAEFYGKQDVLKLAHASVLAQQPDRVDARLPTGEPRTSVVYYVQVDAVIKIGTTVDIAERMKAYPPHARLLATEPGGFALEGRRLREFNEYLRAGREWFWAGPKLRAHIERLMAAAGSDRDAPEIASSCA